MLQCGQTGFVPPRKIGWGLVACFPKPLPYMCIYDQNLQLFPTLFMTRPKISPLIYNNGWHGCLKHNLQRAFIDGRIDNDKEVASSKNIPNSRLERKNHTLFMTKMAKINTLFMTKIADPLLKSLNPLR